MAIALQWSFWWLYLGLIVGHATLGLAFLSRPHGLGISPRWMTPIEVATLVLPGGLAAILGWFILFQPVDAWPVAATVYAYVCCLITYVVLPIITISRSLRRVPSGARITTEQFAKPARLSARTTWIGDGHRAWMLALPGNESLSLQVSRIELETPGLPDDFTDLRVLHISDLHFTLAYERAYFDWVAQAASEFEADLVVFTGDLLDDLAALEWTVPVLGGLRGRLGQYAILGNHDVVHRPGRVRKALRAAGFTIIDGNWITIEDDGQSIALGGTSAPWGPVLDLKQRPDSDLAIVLSHSPDLFPAICRANSVDIVLAGHTHGGQIRVPVFGPLVMPCRTGRRFDRGLFKSGKTWMHVTQGISGKHPLRYGCPPEISLITLTRAPIDRAIKSTEQVHARLS